MRASLMTTAGSARSAFIDIARAIAVLAMLQGHTLHAVLSNDVRTGPLYLLWSFARGQTSCTFLLLSGFVFTLATHRHWTDRAVARAALPRRLRRFAFFLMLGYALHLPTNRIGNLLAVSDEAWRSFVAVDVLQCVAVMLVLLQGLAFATRGPRRFAVAAALACAAVVCLTAQVWRVDWTAQLPMAVAAYLSPMTGSQFPLFPWGAYILFGAVLGELYIRTPASGFTLFANRVLLGGGLVMLGLSYAGSRVPLEPFGPTDFWTTSASLFFMRTGIVLLFLSVVAHISRALPQPHHVLQALAQESLTIYAVHLCLVYGSVWNTGLYQLVGQRLALAPALGIAASMWAAMMLLAVWWQWCKRHRPRAARWTRVALGTVLLARLV
jgi:fucose 4-O-acetylase-like acetyltransferase